MIGIVLIGKALPAPIASWRRAGGQPPLAILFALEGRFW